MISPEAVEWINLLAVVLSPFGSAALILGTYFVWRMKKNHIPHFYKVLNSMGKELSRLRGLVEGLTQGGERVYAKAEERERTVAIAEAGQPEPSGGGHRDGESQLA